MIGTLFRTQPTTENRIDRLQELEREMEPSFWAADSCRRCTNSLLDEFIEQRLELVGF